MDIVNRQLLTLFPTSLFMGTVGDLTMCDRLEKALRALRASKEGIFEQSGYTSPDNLQGRPEMKELVDVVMEESGQILDFMRVKRDSHYITNMWANITNPNHRHLEHVHPNCLLSGIMYLHAPKGAGPTSFSDPRPGARMIDPTYNEMTPQNMGVFNIVPEKGVMLMWPSFLPHAVEQGTASPEEERIVVAFNVMIRGTITNRTARLVLK
jgi:uncharacterized protein (TIGR02466 family)